MINAIRSEWVKLSTLTVNKILIIVAVAFPVVVTASSSPDSATTSSRPPTSPT